MAILFVLRAATTAFSLIILTWGGYLLGSWIAGPDIPGDPARPREDWRLWTALGLLVWSIFGRAFVTPVLAARDRRQTRPRRENGRQQPGASGSGLYVEMHGPEGGPVILFTHGWGLDCTVWSYAKADLAGRFWLVLWDLPGLGRSKPATDDGVSLESFATDLAGLVQALERPVVLVGHSIGGMTIQTLLRDHLSVANRLAGVILLNTTYTDPLKTMLLGKALERSRRIVLEPLMGLAIQLQPVVWIAQWQSYLSGAAHLAHRIGFGRYVTRSQLDHSALLATRNPPGVQARGNLAMFRWDAMGAVAGLSAPLLVIAGGEDLVTKPEASRVLAGMGGGRLEIVEGANHMGFLERPDIYNQLIADFATDVHRLSSRAV